MRSRFWMVIPAAGLLVVPLLIVQAQTTEGDPDSSTTVSEPAAQDTATPEALPPADVVPTEQTAEGEPTAPDLPVSGEVLGAVTETPELQDPSLVTSGPTPEPQTLQTEAASSTASSTEPMSSTEPVREVRTVLLQPSVEIPSHLQVGPVAATITLQNLTCRHCETSSPSATVKAYYTVWYDNDGTEPASTTERLLEQTYSVPSISPWQSNSVQWTGEITTAGRYSFVILVDPNNLIGARDIFRTEFFVD